MRVQTILLISTLFLLSIRSYAYLNIESIGVDQYLKLEYMQLSPVSGLALLASHQIENLYRYGNDNDPTIQLIREMFHIPGNDKINVHHTILPEKPAFYFKASTIGIILNELAVLRTQDELSKTLKNKEMRKKLREKLVSEIALDTGLNQAVAQKKKDLEDQKKQYERNLGYLQMTRAELEQHFQDLQNRQKAPISNAKSLTAKDVVNQFYRGINKKYNFKPNRSDSLSNDNCTKMVKNQAIHSVLESIDKIKNQLNEMRTSELDSVDDKKRQAGYKLENWINLLLTALEKNLDHNSEFPQGFIFQIWSEFQNHFKVEM